MSPLSAIDPLSRAYNMMGQHGLAAPRLTPEISTEFPVEGPGKTGGVQPSADSFATMLNRFVEEVNTKQNIASETVNALQSGQNVSLHQAVIAMEEASVSFQLMTEVRNKLLESYQELMRMQI